MRTAVPSRAWLACDAAAAPVVAVLHHLRQPFLGYAGPPLRAAGVTLDERFPRDGDGLPDLDAIDGIVSLGGEQNALDPGLAAEAALLREAVDHGVPVLGVCLGAQLLAHALGGAVRRLPRRHLDWLPLEPLPSAHGDPVLGDLPPHAAGLHWNEDGFDLPAGVTELLRSRAARARRSAPGRRTSRGRPTASTCRGSGRCPRRSSAASRAS